VPEPVVEVVPAPPNEPQHGHSTPPGKKRPTRAGHLPPVAQPVPAGSEPIPRVSEPRPAAADLAKDGDSEAPIPRVRKDPTSRKAPSQ
jgi:hypothetical protein